MRHEPVQPADRLVHDAQALQETLPLQQFEPRRAAYLAKQLRALETVSRRLRGEHFSLPEQARLCYDLEIDWLPESIFEQAYSLYDEALPGRGSIAARLQRWQESFMLPPDMAMKPTSLPASMAVDSWNRFYRAHNGLRVCASCSQIKRLRPICEMSESRLSGDTQRGFT